MALRAPATRRPPLDAHRFDSLTRTLSTSGTRRALSGLLATLLSLLALTRPGSPLSAEAKKKNRRRRKKARTEGPCGDGGGKANRCQRNRQCCTGYCKQRKKKRKNGRRRKVQGRCRCRKDGQSCADDRNCCSEQTGRACIEGTCRTPCADLCPAGCCAGETCEAGTSDAACGTGGETCQTCAGQTPLCDAEGCICGHVCADGCPFSSIQDAIDAATAGDTIRLCAETYTGSITVTKDLTILGVGQDADGSVLDGQRQGRVITVNEGVNASLAGLRITGGYAEDSENSLRGCGGGIFNAGGVVMLSRSTLTDNESSYGGGGIFSHGGAFTLTNCTIMDNTAGEFGGGIRSSWYQGVGPHTIDLIDCTVANNITSGRLGGGIFAQLATTVTLDGTTVTGNISSEEGGGIYCDVNGTVNLTGGSTVSGNIPDNCAAPSSGNINGPGCAPNP